MKILGKLKRLIKVITEYISWQLVVVIAILDIFNLTVIPEWGILVLLLIPPLLEAGITLIYSELSGEEEENVEDPNEIDVNHLYFLLEHKAFDEAVDYLKIKLHKEGK